MRALGAGLCVLTLLVVGAVAGGVRARESVVRTRADVYERLRLADLELKLSPTERGVLARSRLPDGVALAEERTLALGRLTGGTALRLACLVRLLPAEPPRLNRLEIEPGGRYPEPDEAALVVDRSLRDQFGLGVGATARLEVGADVRELPVVGVSLSPEHLTAPAHPAYALPLKGSAGVVGVSEAAARGIARATKTTSILVAFEAGADAAATERALPTGVDAQVRESVPAAREPGRLFADFLLAQFDLYLPTIVGGFALLGLVLLALFAARSVDRRRREVGLRLALGHGGVRISAGFLGPPLLATAAGALFALLLHGAVARATAGPWAHAMGFPPLLEAGVPLDAWAAATAACLATVAAAIGLPLALLARREPAALLHETALSAPRRPGVAARALARLGDAALLPPPLALALAGAARRRRETLGAILGVAASVALVLAFLAVHVSHRVEAREALSRSTPGATLHWLEPKDAAAAREAGAALGGESAPIVARSARLAGREGLLARRVLGVEPGAWLDAQPLAEGRRFASSDAREALVDPWVARKDGLALGDLVTLYPDAQAPEGVEVRVVGVLDGMSFGRIVLPLGTAQTLFGLDGLATGVHVAGAVNEERASAMPDVETHVTAAQALEHVDAAFSGSLAVLRLALWAAVAVALLVLALLAVEDARDRAPEAALLEALGWSRGARASVTLGEVLARGVPALGLAALLAPPLAAAFLARVESVNGYRVALHVPGWLVAAVLVPGVLLLPLAALPAWLRTRKGEPAPLLRELGNG
jgi:hypothetical protein